MHVTLSIIIVTNGTVLIKGRHISNVNVNEAEKRYAKMYKRPGTLIVTALTLFATMKQNDKPKNTCTHTLDHINI